MALDYRNYGVFLIMGNAGFISINRSTPKRLKLTYSSTQGISRDVGLLLHRLQVVIGVPFSQIFGFN